MKVIKLLLATTILAMGVSVSSCSSEDETSGSGKMLSRLTIEEDGRYQAFHFSWSGQRVSFIEVWESNYYGVMLRSAEITPTYNDGRLESIYAYSAEDRSGITLQCSYSGNQLTQIEVPREEPVLLSYDTEGHLHTANINRAPMSLAWNGGQIARYTDSEGRAVAVACDEKRNPLNDIIRCIIGSWSPTMGNITSLVNHRGETINFHYTYDGDYPTQCRATDGKEGVVIYFQYADGSGTAPVNLPANYASRSGQRISPLPLL